ncbi:putative ubiquitin carboxyl-terminal hydrolase MINDY-1 [Heracleum sosnowskyi]|uniref:Ubiquitin carboxyl-terminal hydrolase MINDY-1 n=1 Tax=Heracleum sosnowskyi TaxID=360622 RepID=A0AAD8MG77_9APIA|nr:putative ubiquitin carboxyl-terminal hydrolase MINDY-1 [Heracleum sosnowskyi]
MQREDRCEFLDSQEVAVSNIREPDPLLPAACSAYDSEGGAELDSSGDDTRNKDVLEAVTPSGEATEPIYAGEECILEPGTTYEDREPVYEGEVVLAEQLDENSKNANDVACKTEISLQQGELIKDFLKANASQLTVYGLICLQEELKERELCVFFRNNHFNTMFKLGGELYLLKLNEVNGNTVFMTGSFKEFKAEEDHINSSWDEQNARASTADYLASINDPAQDNSSFNSDLQLAMTLQEQEFEQQPQRNPQKQTVFGGSGPQEKCVVM